MKIGDVVAIRMSRRLTPVFGRLLSVTGGGIAVVDVNGRLHTRQLKRVLNYRTARSEIDRKKHGAIHG